MTIHRNWSALVDSGKISSRIAQEVFAEMFETR